MECASVSLSLALRLSLPRRSSLALLVSRFRALTDPFDTVSFSSSCVLLPGPLDADGGQGRGAGRAEDSLLCIRRQWHGPPHSSYLHSFNATWGPWNVHQPRGLRTAGPTVPLIPLPPWHSSLLQTPSAFRGKSIPLLPLLISISLSLSFYISFSVRFSILRVQREIGARIRLDGLEESGREETRWSLLV